MKPLEQKNYFCTPKSFRYKKDPRGITKDLRFIMIADFSMDVFYLHYKEFTFSKDVEHEYFSITKEGVITAKADYGWNGANKPAINNLQNRFASLPHDIICQAINLGLLEYKDRFTADKIFLALMQDRAKSMFEKFRSYYSYTAVSAMTIVKGIFNKPKLKR